MTERFIEYMPSDGIEGDGQAAYSLEGIVLGKHVTGAKVGGAEVIMIDRGDEGEIVDHDPRRTILPSGIVSVENKPITDPYAKPVRGSFINLAGGAEPVYFPETGHFRGHRDHNGVINRAQAEGAMWKDPEQA